ncbi:conserved Plasmodium protein, unknown function [Plasmodium ovale curtisi]|uniref:Uncharacterized protein n=1 Tax=Plasmodium ovale curtisi TaxID=864141 RepID=A0A1A8W029_PLAOA|nr:conserved Plasmodium protein, unknown function [Plasmodium ovale curtisi]
MKHLPKCNKLNVTKWVHRFVKEQLLNCGKIKRSAFGTAIENNDTEVKRRYALCLDNSLNEHNKISCRECLKDGKINTVKIDKVQTYEKENNLNSNGQSDIVRKIRKFCRKDDLCNIYKINDQFLQLLKSKKVNRDDFSIIIHLLSKKKIRDNSFWKSIANTENINFIFSMNLKQIILSLYSIANSCTYINQNFINIFTHKLICILYYQKEFLLLEKKKNTEKGEISRIDMTMSPFYLFSDREISNYSMINLKSEAKHFSVQTNNVRVNLPTYEEHEKTGWNKLFSKNNYEQYNAHFCKNWKNKLNFLDLTLICNTYSKLSGLHHLHKIDELRRILCKLFLYFLFFNKANSDHLILFIHSFTKLKGNIEKSILVKIKKVLLKRQNGLYTNFCNLHSVDICSLNMLLQVLQRNNFKSDHFFREIILSFVININLKEEKKCKGKKGVLNRDDYTTGDSLFPMHEYALQVITKSKTNEASEKCKIESGNAWDKTFHHHASLLKRKLYLIDYFQQNNNTYLAQNRNLVKLKKKDLCFLAYNIYKLKIKNYYNIYEYIKCEMENQIKFFNVYNCCIMLNFLVNLKLLDQNLFTIIFSHIKILFDKNHYNEKDVTDMFTSFYKYAQTTSKNNKEISTFLRTLYLKIELKLKKYIYPNFLSIFFSSSHFNILFDDSILQDLCIDTLNSSHTVSAETLLTFLYFLKSRKYNVDFLFFNSILDKALSKIKDTETFFFCFQMLSIYSVQTLQNGGSIFARVTNLLGRYNSFLHLKEKIILAIHIYSNPVLLLNEECFLFCEKTLESAVWSDTGDDKFGTREEANGEKNSTGKNLMTGTCSMCNKKNRFPPFFSHGYGNNNDLFSSINLCADRIDISEWKIFFLLLLSDMHELKYLLFGKYEHFKRGGKNRKDYSMLVNVCELRIQFHSVYIRLSNDCLDYFLRRNQPLLLRLPEIKRELVDINKINSYGDMFGSSECSDNVINKQNLAFENDNREMVQYFCHFEEALFNSIRILYEDMFIYSFCQKKEQEIIANVLDTPIKGTHYADSHIFYTNDKLIIKLKKKKFINSFHISYILQPFQ